jgi:hypothetical protein
MIVEDEKNLEDIEEELDLNQAPNVVIVEPPEFAPGDYVPFGRVLENMKTFEIKRLICNSRKIWWSIFGIRTAVVLLGLQFDTICNHFYICTFYYCTNIYEM